MDITAHCWLHRPVGVGLHADRCSVLFLSQVDFDDLSQTSTIEGFQFSWFLSSHWRGLLALINRRWIEKRWTRSLLYKLISLRVHSIRLDYKKALSVHNTISSWPGHSKAELSKNILVGVFKWLTGEEQLLKCCVWTGCESFGFLLSPFLLNKIEYFIQVVNSCNRLLFHRLFLSGISCIRL